MEYAYSWMGTRIHFVLKEEVADAYNRAVDAWFEAQKYHEKRYGRKWDPVKEPFLFMEWTDEERNAYDTIANVINMLSKLNGGFDIPEEETSSDYLVKVEG